MYLNKVTYPRFLLLPSGDLLFELRIGRSGLGDDYLYRYSAATGSWRAVGAHNGLFLKGIENNPYINGMDYACGRLHISWTYRDFVEDGGEKKDGESGQAGPNGPENNHDFCYIYSDDEGETWCDTKGRPLPLPVLPSPEITIYTIPKYSEIMNQEGQAADRLGHFHGLNRANGKYQHYHRRPDGEWSVSAINDIPAVSFGCRGKLAVDDATGSLYALLPGNVDSTFSIVRARAPLYDRWDVVWAREGYDAEPLYDRYRSDGVLSVLQRNTGVPRKTFVMDFKLE
ncbi:uncharacterized protein V1510DRAFT_418220 [Dipodascopsis tothii]|uniref:uncharacterized protein n=1 Tax=Dipodascopsis tothii TaxID=44089 RepID=UPI0034CE0D3C